MARPPGVLKHPVPRRVTSATVPENFVAKNSEAIKTSYKSYCNMVQLKSSLLMAIAISSTMAMVLPKPVDGNYMPFRRALLVRYLLVTASAVAARDAEPKTYSGTFINRYDEVSEEEKREAEAEPVSKATYSGTFINRYDETSEKAKREAEAKPEAKATYSGTFINRYDEVAEQQE